jgi:outer membrane protein OmpA-like peptidoglycan-associated protein
MKKLFFLFSILVSGANVIAQTNVEVLGDNINSASAELRPTVSFDGKKLYYIVEGVTIDESKSKKYGQTVWYSELDTKNKWGKAVKCTTPINGQLDNAVFWVSPDGNTVLIRGAYTNGKLSGKGFSLSTKTAGVWGEPKKINIAGYAGMSIDIYSGASMSNDGKVLFLYFSEEKNNDNNDIYISKKIDENNWSAPVKVTSLSNDDDDEISPFVAADNVTLYFSSNRKGGKGGHDIWMTKRLDNSWLKWSNPMNMGDSVNSEKWEAYFSTDAAGEFGYLSTNNNSLGETDIAKVKLNKWQQAKSFVQIKGKMVNAKSNNAVDAKLSYDVISEDGVKTVTVTTTNGNYDITLPYGKKYVITSKADNYFEVKDTIDLLVADLNKEVNRDFYLVPEIVINDYNDTLRLDQDGNIVERKRISLDDNLTDLKPGEILVTNNILFDFAKSLLRNEAYAELDKIVRMMRANPTMKIELAAYTDEIGNGKRNQDLSEDRAFAAKQYLLSKSIEADRIISKGFGKLNPIASNKTEEGRQKNRRVEFKILEK